MSVPFIKLDNTDIQNLLNLCEEIKGDLNDSERQTFQKLKLIRSAQQLKYSLKTFDASKDSKDSKDQTNG